MAEMLHIGAGVFAALDDYVQGVCSAHSAACSAGIDEVLNDLRSKARKSPQWRGLSDSIEAWVDGGEIMVGVRDPNMVKGALDAEYGNSSSPPSPIVRMTTSSARKAAERMSSVYRAHLGGDAV